MPSGRRVSSPWITGSPSHESVGPGGCDVDVICSRNRSSASAGESPRSTAMSLRCNLSKLKPDEISFTKNDGTVILADAVMCATTSRTDQPSHNEIASHCSSLRPRRSSASAARSRWIIDQVSALFIDLLLGSHPAGDVDGLVHVHRAAARKYRASVGQLDGGLEVGGLEDRVAGQRGRRAAATDLGVLTERCPAVDDRRTEG